MNNNIFKVGAIVGAIATAAPLVNAQSIVSDPLLLAQTDSQGCVYYEKGVPGSGGQPAKVCKEPKFNGIRIDACLFAYGDCKKEASGEEFCRLQGDGYTEYISGGVTPSDPPQTISITNGKIHQSKYLSRAPFSYKSNNNGRLVAFSSIRCRKPGDVANKKPKKEQTAAKEVANQLQIKYPNLNINSYHKDIAWELANRQARGEKIQESINNTVNAISGKISNER